MPSYRTHSIHGKKVMELVDKRVNIDTEDIKSFSMGPDTLIMTDYHIFNRQHKENVKEFFIELLKTIKKSNLQDNAEVMAFLYGQLDHLVLDSVTHPLIYYMTEGINKKHIMNPHAIIEMWMDDYFIKKFNDESDPYYHKSGINSEQLKRVINKIYYTIFHSKNESIRYSAGIRLMNMYDAIIRKNHMLISPLLLKITNFGDIVYRKNADRVKKYLNLNRDIWYNPETNEQYTKSIDDLWNDSIEMAQETMMDVNRYLYLGDEIRNPIILNNTSYNTGLDCDKGQVLKYIKRYK